MPLRKRNEIGTANHARYTNKDQISNFAWLAWFAVLFLPAKNAK